MGFVDGLGGAASTLVQCNYLTAALLRAQQTPSFRAQRSNLSPCATPPVTATAYGRAATRDCFVASLLAMTASRNDSKSLSPAKSDKEGVAGWPQPTLCKHGGEAEPATLAVEEIASACGLAMTHY